MSHHWGYANSELPPDKWYELYSIAKTGKRQSPIDLDSRGTQRAPFYNPLNFDYHPNDVKSVKNNGHSVTFSTSGGKSALSGGPLKNRYTLEQFHFHWGADSSRGSEHTMEGRRFAAEVHFVHWNSDKYKSFNDSLDHEDGLCVLGTFVMGGGPDNREYKNVVDAIKNVPLKGNSYTLQSGFNFESLLPRDRYLLYHYSGSLTTPPLKECVQWIVFKMPVDISESQLQEFRKLHLGETSASAHLCDNYRPTQDLHSRPVYDVLF